MYNDKFNELMSEVKVLFNEIKTKKELEEAKNNYVGKSGKITLMNQLIKEVPNEEKREFGMKVNEVKNYFNSEFDRIFKELELK